MQGKIERIERSALKVVLILIGAALLTGLQLRLAPHCPGLTRWFPETLSCQIVAAPALAAALGFIFGMIGCPICGLPLAACISLRDQSTRHAVLATGFFNLGRLATFLLLGTLVWAGFRIVGLFAAGMGSMVLFCGVGFLMILLGVELFFTRESSRRAICGADLSLHLEGGRGYARYFFWGAGIGLACGTEAIVFALPAWAWTTTAGFPAAMLILLVFCLAAFLPITLLVLAASVSVGILRKILSKGVFTTLRYIGGASVMLLGIRFICLGFKGLTAL